MPPVVADAVAGLGLNLPGDLRTVLGTDTALALTGDLSDPTVVAHVRTAQPAQAVAVLNRLSARLGDSAPWCPCPDGAFSAHAAKTGYVLTSRPGAKLTGDLGKTASFTLAVPDAKTAGLVLYVNVRRLPAEMRQAVPGIDAVGLSVNGATGEFRLRVTTG
jgi:hypothetical protein